MKYLLIIWGMLWLNLSLTDSFAQCMGNLSGRTIDSTNWVKSVSSGELLVSGQVFAPVGAVWHYNQTFAFSGNSSFVRIESVGDTIIAGKACRILEANVNTCSGESIRNFIWNDQNRIYFFDQQRFKLLYDFNTIAGSNWEIVMDAFGTNDTISVYVDSVGSEIYGGMMLKVLHVSIHSDLSGFIPKTSKKIIERIGDWEFLFPWLIGVCDGNFAGPLRCYEDSEIMVMNDDFFDCEYITGIEKANKHYSENQVYPNPISHSFILNIPHAASCGSEFNIFNASGKAVAHGKLECNESSIDLSSIPLNAGSYYLRYVDFKNEIRTVCFII